MEQHIGLWSFDSSGRLQRLPTTQVQLEKDLEGMICRRPDLLEDGLTIVGRQVWLGEGSKLDLLAVDASRRQLVVVEVKKGAVDLATVAQARRYSSLLDKMSNANLLKAIEKAQHLQSQGSKLPQATVELLDEVFAQPRLPVSMYVVGVTRAPELAGHMDPLVNIVSFRVFRDRAGNHLLVRNLSEAESSPPMEAGGPEQAVAQARKEGITDMFMPLHQVAVKHDMVVRVSKTRISYYPPRKRTLLMTVFTKPSDGKLQIRLCPDAIGEHYGKDAGWVRKCLGTSERKLDAVQAGRLAWAMTKVILEEPQPGVISWFLGLFSRGSKQPAASKATAGKSNVAKKKRTTSKRKKKPTAVQLDG